MLLLEDQKYSCLLIPLPPNLTAAIIALGRYLIHAKDLAEDGFEEEPHVTLLYGLHQEILDQKLRYALESAPKFAIKVGKLGVFSTPKGDVVHIKVSSQPLHDLHFALRADFPNTQTFPDYNPHITLAYLKPGAGAKFDGLEHNLTDFSWKTNIVKFSSPDRLAGYVSFGVRFNANSLLQSPNSPTGAGSPQTPTAPAPATATRPVPARPAKVLPMQPQS